MANLLMENVFKDHRFPKIIALDKDPVTTNLIQKVLFENVGINFNFSFIYHPQTNGQSETTNFLNRIYSNAMSQK